MFRVWSITAAWAPPSEVATRFGLLPNFLRLASADPTITRNLLGFAQFAYLDNPMPSLFKERLFVYLSRFCDVRYCIARHVGFLVGLGRPAGDPNSIPQTVENVLRLLKMPLAQASKTPASDPGEAFGAHLQGIIGSSTPAMGLIRGRDVRDIDWVIPLEKSVQPNLSSGSSGLADPILAAFNHDRCPEMNAASSVVRNRTASVTSSLCSIRLMACCSQVLWTFRSQETPRP